MISTKVLKKIAAFCGKDDPRYELNQIIAEDGKLYACDGFCLVEIEYTLDIPDEQINIPANIVKSLPNDNNLIICKDKICYKDGYIGFTPPTKPFPDIKKALSLTTYAAREQLILSSVCLNKTCALAKAMGSSSLHFTFTTSGPQKITIIGEGVIANVYVMEMAK